MGLWNTKGLISTSWDDGNEKCFQEIERKVELGHNTALCSIAFCPWECDHSRADIANYKTIWPGSCQKSSIWHKRIWRENCAGFCLTLIAITVHHTFQAAGREGIIDTVLIYAGDKKAAYRCMTRGTQNYLFVRPSPPSHLAGLGWYMGKRLVQKALCQVAKGRKENTARKSAPRKY